MNGDTIRWVAIVVCIFNVGVMVALYERVGKYFLPKLWMRMLFASNALYIITIGFGLHSRIGHPLAWRTPILAFSVALQLVALIGLHLWYGSRAGRAHSARMTRSMVDNT